MARKGHVRPGGRQAGGTPPVHPGAPHDGAARWWPAILLIAAVLAVYANALPNPFVFDDQSTIADNVTIRDVASSLAGGPVQSATAGRPLVNLSFALNYAAHATRPAGYHLANAAILAACGLLLYGITRRVLRLPDQPAWLRDHAQGLAVSTALLWSLHPLHTEAVNYVTQRSESLVTLAYLATVYAALRAITGGGRAWAAAAVGACAAGMACKESMVTAPVVVLLLDGAFVSGSLLVALRRRTGFYGALAATWLVLAALVVGGPRWRSAGFSSGVDPWTYLLNQAPMLVRYLRVSIWPTGLVLDYGLPRPLSLAEVWPAGGLVVLLLLLSAVTWWRRPAVGVLALSTFVVLAPTSSFVPIATEVGAERRMMLPLAALVALAVVAAARGLLALPAGIRRRVGVTAVAVVAVAYAAGVVVRNREYRTGLTVWDTVVARWDHARAHYNRGIELRAAGRRSEAIAEFERSLAEAPLAHYALGFELQADGRHDEAARHYEAFIAAEPFDANVLRAYHQLGRARLAQGRLEEALAAFRELLARSPANADAVAGEADTLLAMKRWDEAIAAYTRYLTLNPASTGALFNMGLAHFEVNRFPDAERAFRAVLDREPSNVAAYVNLANVAGSTGRYGDAVQLLRRAAELETDPAARQELLLAVRQIIGH